MMKSHSNILLVSMLIAATCFAIFAAEIHGFRVFDDGFGWHASTKERTLLSIPELMVFFGSLGVGAVSGIVALISIAVHLKQRVARNTHSQ